MDPRAATNKLRVPFFKLLPKVRTPLVLHYSQEVSNDPLGRGAACRPVAMEVLNCRFA